DVADHKFGYRDGDRENIIKNAIGIDSLSDEQINHIVYIANNISFSKGKPLETLESKIVQDADRLDALGAIGIARAFTYGGFFKRDIYNIEGDNDTISHFYEKLLKLKDLMNTEAGKKEALEREQFMVAFLKQFFKEIDWNDILEIIKDEMKNKGESY
ncbi:MAG: HD domain-containing protein, partial [Cetobacterium somerae]